VQHSSAPQLIIVPDVANGSAHGGSAGWVHGLLGLFWKSSVEATHSLLFFAPFFYFIFVVLIF
jgi:hypothetical protein